MGKVTDINWLAARCMMGMSHRHRLKVSLMDKPSHTGVITHKHTDVAPPEGKKTHPPSSSNLSFTMADGWRFELNDVVQLERAL